MRPSSDRLADDNGDVRASDAERDRAIGELQDRFAEGRLSQETFLYRMDAALNAKDRAELSDLFTDLPPAGVRRGSSPWGNNEQRRRASERLRERLTLLRMAVTGRPDPSTRLLRAPKKAQLAPPLTGLPPLPLPPHARLYQEDDQWLLSDLGSTNGTRLNGWRVTTGVPVKPGDHVSFGSISFVITDRTPSKD